jgi:hypothetical protein
MTLYAFFWVKFIHQRFENLRLFYLYRRVDMMLHIYPPMEMERTECSETLAYKLQKPVNHPEKAYKLQKPVNHPENSEHRENFKSWVIFRRFTLWNFVHPPSIQHHKAKDKGFLNLYKFHTHERPCCELRPAAFEALNVRAVNRSPNSWGNLHLVRFHSVLFSNTVSLCSRVLTCSDTNDSQNLG